MTLQELRDLVRSQMDVDELELPNSVLDVWFREGFTKAIAAERRWPFYASDWAIVFTDGVATRPADLDDPESVRVGTTRLHRIEQFEGEDYFGSSTGEASYWSEWGESLHLWPATTGTATATVRGFRKPTDWVATGAASVVDADTRLHMAPAFYALAQAYLQQEDEVLSARYSQQFEETVARARNALMAVRGGVKVLGSTLPRWTDRGPHGPYAVTFQQGPTLVDDGVIDGGSP